MQRSMVGLGALVSVAVWGCSASVEWSGRAEEAVAAEPTGEPMIAVRLGPFEQGTAFQCVVLAQPPGACETPDLVRVAAWASATGEPGGDPNPLVEELVADAADAAGGYTILTLPLVEPLNVGAGDFVFVGLMLEEPPCDAGGIAPASEAGWRWLPEQGWVEPR